MADPRAVLLNGPSSSGKSTLAEALKALIAGRLSEKYEVVSIDGFMKTDPMETIYEDDVFEISGDLCARVSELLSEGTGVIIDHVITSERIFRQLQEALRPETLFLVQVSCPLEILRQREQARGDRCPGSAESSAAYLYPKEGYDMTVDTGRRSPAENAALIFSRLFPDRQPG